VALVPFLPFHLTVSYSILQPTFHYNIILCFWFVPCSLFVYNIMKWKHETNKAQEQPKDLIFGLLSPLLGCWLLIVGEDI